MATEPVKASVRLLRRTPSVPRPSVPVEPAKPAPRPVPKPEPTVDELLTQGINGGKSRGEVVKEQALVIDGRQTELRAQQKTVSDLIVKLEKSQGDLKASLEAKRAELATLEKRGGILDTVKQKYEAEIAKDEAALAALEAKLGALRAESARLSREARHLGAGHRVAYDKATAAESYLRYLESLEADGVPDLEKKMAEAEAQGEEVADAKKLVKKAEQAIGENKAATKDNARAQGQTLKDVASTQTMLADEKAALAATEKELTDVRAKSRELKAKASEQLGLIEANDRALRSAKGRISGIQDEIGKLEARRKALIEAAIDANNQDVDAILARLDGLDKTASRLRKELIGAQADLQEALSHREILEAGKKALTQDMAELAGRLRKLMGDKNVTEADIAAARSDLSSARADIGTMNHKDKFLVEHGNGLSDERFKLLEEQKALEELATLPPEKLSEADKQRLANRKDLSESIDALTKRIQEANAKRTALAKELEKRMADIKEATGRIDQAKVKLDEIEVDILEDRKAQDVTEAELRQTERDIRDASRSIESAIADQKAIRAALARLDAEQQALDERRTELQKDSAQLRKLER